MMFRCFLVIGVALLFTVVLNAQFVKAVEEVEEIEDRQAAQVVAKLIGKLFAGAAASCLGEAAEKCKSNWKNPKNAINCAKNFLSENKGRCAVGK